MQYLQLDLELKMESNTILLETHGELIGVKMDTLELLSLQTEQEFVESY